MSKNRRNNHYHYAEKFDVKPGHSRSGRTAFIPFKSVIISLVVLLMFGLVSTTFGAYIVEDEPEYDPEEPAIISEVRNIKASRDVALTGATMDLAETGGNITGGTVVVEVPSSWTSYSHIQFGLYQGGYLWCSDDMTRIANTNFYYASNPNHSSWSNEQIMFMANNSHFGSGSFDGTNSAKYSGKITQAMSSNYYTFWLSGLANAYTNTYKGNFDSLANAIYIYDQKAYIYTSTTGSAASNYTSSGTGGNVTITASYLDTANNSATQSTTPSSNGATSVTYEHAVYHTSVTYIATANSGYRFVGWYTSTTATSAESTNASYQCTSSLTGTNTLYARFIKRVTVSITKSPSAYTGTAPTVTGGGSTAASITVDVGTSVTLNSNCSSPVTCTFKSGSASGSTLTSPITVSANTSVYACYTLSAPKNLSISYAGSPTVEGAAAISVTKSASRYAGSAGTLDYSFAIVTGGTGPSGGATVDASTGAFSGTIAGTYKVRMTVTHTQAGLSASSTKDATVTVKPAPVTGFSYTAVGYNKGVGTQAEPWKVPVNSTSFAITSFIPDDGSRDPNYTYTWTRTDGTYLISSGAITAGSGSVSSSGVYVVTDTATSGTATTDVIHNTTLADTQGYIYKVGVTKTRNNVTSDPYYVTFYYGVTADFLVIDEFDFAQFNDTPGEEIQKIYAEDNGITYIKSDYTAGGSSFHTMLWFSKDNITENKVAVWTPSQFTISAGNRYAGTHSALPNDAAHRTGDLITQIATSVVNGSNVATNLMSTLGPKWFNGYVDDYNNPRVDPCFPVVHTTVGTSSTVANRPVYFKDTTGVTHVNSRLMAFYTVEGDNTVHYQTGQAVKEVVNGVTSVKHYRFYVPSDAVNISFAYVAENNYVLPTVSNATFSYAVYTDHTVLMAWTNTIDLTAEANEGMTTFVADTPGTADANGIYNYTNTANSGNMTTLS